MERVGNSCLSFREESSEKFLIYNHNTGGSHLVDEGIISILKEYYFDKDSFLKKAENNQELKKLLRLLKGKRLI